MTEETRQALKQAQAVLDEQIQKAQMKRNEEDRKFILAGIANELRPLFRELFETLVDNIKKATMNINADIKVPEPKVTIPPIKIPDIKVPEARVRVEIPPIRVPEPRVTVKAADVKFPPFPKMPKKMEVEGDVGIKGFSRDNPLPVTLFNQKGEYIDPTKINVNAVGGGGGPRIVEIKKIQGADSIGTGTKTVAVAGTAEQIVSITTPIRRVWIQALETNTGAICIGGRDVDETPASRKGLALYATQGQWFNINDLSKLWIDVALGGEGFNYLYEN